MQYRLGLTNISKRLGERFRSDVKTLDKAVLRSAKDVADDMEVIAKRNLSNDILNVRSGALRRSAKGRVVGSRDNIKIGLGSVKGPSSPYAASLEDGGRNKGFIYPKNRKWLTIPQKPALTPAGVPRYASARDVPVRLKFIKSRKDPNTAVLVEDTLRITKKKYGRSKTSGRIWYVLKKFVFVQPAKWLTKSFEQGSKGIDKDLGDGIIRHLTKGV